MAKYCLKKPSKRLTCKKKFKIQRKVREHSRKLRKLSKESERKKKSDKPVSVPNKCPFKEELLMEAEQKRAELKTLETERKARQKIAKTSGKKTQQTKRKTKTDDTSIEALAKRANNDEVDYNANRVLAEMLPEKTNNADADGAKSVRSFAAEVRRTIENADIIIEVLDARDPFGSRSDQIEKLVIESGKRLVLLLNKIDLVPRENLLKWLAHLRQQLPTIAFKASTQEQNQKLGRYQTSNLSNTFSAKCIGADLVMKLLGNYCRNKDIKTSIRVGIVGFPNVGKSSVINSLKRRKCCQTGALPGLTRQLQEVELDKHIRLIDSPGVVLAPKGTLNDAAELSLRNAVRVDSLVDPISPVNAILRRCSIKTLMLHYGIPQFDDCDQFLALLSRRFGRLKKGGRPNLIASAKQVLKDWNSGKLRYYTEPPEQTSPGGDNNSLENATEIVATFSKEFDLDALEQDIRVLVDAIPQDAMAVDTPYDPTLSALSTAQSGGGAGDGNAEMETDQKHGGGGGGFVVVSGRVVPPAEEGGSSSNMDTAPGGHGTANVRGTPLLPNSLSLGEGNVQLNSAIRKAVKKRKKGQQKMAKRAEKLAGQLSERMEF